MTRTDDPRTFLERALTAMKSSATTCEIRPDDRRGPADGMSPSTEGPNWTVRPYLHAREIRVGWTEGLLMNGDGTPCNGGLWHPDTEYNRLLLLLTVAEGQRLFGLMTHWLEERDA
ncbi:hypothetical protein [Variovorax sp. YR216]|uniref:hypothetical protein n=1 Tax=Variovorax sp. YR216 TaxID=1882828 RepID=UPI0008993D75|nr:hypothetical protein [Variovorax sp. YR216]SEB05679.1 hypothetical protein SAMN05444680_106171 [Variovorax sp. YR216]